MHWIDRLTKAQRVVVVIALGLALGTVGSYLVRGSGVAFGWTGYAPLTSQIYGLGIGPRPWLRVIIWLVLISLWALGSVRVLRPSTEKTHSVPQAARKMDSRPEP